MATLKQIEANRRNSQKSTGPRTALGKIRASRNSMKHNKLARNVLLPTESKTAFRRHAAALMHQFAPVGYIETVTVEFMILASWRMERMRSLEARALTAGAQASPACLQILSKLVASARRSFHSSLRALKAMQSRRAKSDQNEATVITSKVIDIEEYLVKVALSKENPHGTQTAKQADANPIPAA